jgi:hypothetical protein
VPIFGRNRLLVHRRTYREPPKLPIKGRYRKSWAAEVSIKGRYWARPAAFWHVLGLEPHLAESRIKETTVSVTKFETVRAHQALCLRPGRTEGRVDQE